VKLSIITLGLLYPSTEIGFHWPLIAIAQPQPGEYTLTQKPPPRGVFQVLMKVMWLPMVLKKSKSLHSGRSVMTHKLHCQASAGGDALILQLFLAVML